MMLKKPWWGALTVACIVLFLTNCQSITPASLQPESPEVLLVSITPLDTTMFEQRLQVDLRVRNPNDFDLEVTGLDFTLHLNEQRLARGLSNKSSTISRLGDALVSVETTTSTLDVVRQLLNFRQDQNLTYQVTGIVHVQGQRLPFEHKGVLIDASQFSSSSPGL
ncbi:MAG: LEA type 2 family protein [Nitrospirota bacterium]|nr:LEA type 2 family protein [Nitrospirota bacterium]